MSAPRWRQAPQVQSTLVEDEGGPSIRYLAGFFDGEGCFTSTIPDKDKPVQFLISLTTTREEEPRMFQSMFGGGITHTERSGNHSDCWKWTVSRTIARVVAERLYPHLKGKREQCGVFIDAIKYKQEHHRESKPYPDAILEEMHEYGKRVRSFNSAQRYFGTEGK